MGENQLSEDMGIAQRMQTAGEFEISVPAIMNETTRVEFQNGKVIQCFLAAFFVNSVPGSGRGGEEMEPVERREYP